MSGGSAMEEPKSDHFFDFFVKDLKCSVFLSRSRRLVLPM